MKTEKQIKDRMSEIKEEIIDLKKEYDALRWVMEDPPKKKPVKRD